MAAPARCGAFEVEEVSQEELEALDAALQVAVPQTRRPAPPAAALQPAVVACVGHVTCEAVSVKDFVLRVPSQLSQRVHAALEGAGLKMEAVGCSPAGDEVLQAPLDVYKQVAAALQLGSLFRAPPFVKGRLDLSTFDGGGRIPAATIDALEKARRLKLGERERAEQEEERYSRIPQALRATLLPFQQEGVRIGIRRGGRMLLADEVGVGKTFQALALATSYADQGPVLVICPASLRLMWAEQAERWWRGLAPSACTVVLDSSNKPELDNLPRRGAQPPSAPRMVITSYNMLQLSDLTVDWAGVAWGCVIVDESHVMRTTNGTEPAQTLVAARVVRAAPHAILLSGTPALNRPFDLFCQADTLWPGLLGASKEDFARAYCERRFHNGHITNGGGARLGELHMLLSKTVMLRREKKDVAADLPAIFRQVIRLDVEAAAVFSSTVEKWDGLVEPQRVAWRKSKAAVAWLCDTLLRKDSTCKVVIFVHHKGIFDLIMTSVLVGHLGVDEDGDMIVPEPYVSIRGNDDNPSRDAAVAAFNTQQHVRVALLSITAASVGLDFSSADAAVFLELPEEAADLEQAIGRVHRRGVKGDANGNVNFYFLCGHGTCDETHWSTIAANLARCHAVHGAHDSDGLRADLVVDAKEGAAAQLPVLIERPPPCPAAPPAEAQPMPPSAAIVEPEDLAAVPANRLFFELSRNTRRLHAFLQESPGFKHLESIPSALLAATDQLPFPFSSPFVRSAAVAFLAVWDTLAPMDRETLWRQKGPVRLPFDELLNAARAARKTAPSTIRSAKPVDVIPPPPAGSAGSRFVHLSIRNKHYKYPLHISAEGEWLCRACSSKPARVQHPDGQEARVDCLLDLCCSEDCHFRLRLQTDSRFMRAELFKQDRGVCRECGLDCDSLFERLRCTGLEHRRKLLLKMDVRFGGYEALTRAVVEARTAGALWQADHIIPVAEGGGLCGLDNMRTLCVLCHAAASAKQAGRGAKRRRNRGAALDPAAAAATEAAFEQWTKQGDDDFVGADEARAKREKEKAKALKAKKKAGK